MSRILVLCPTHRDRRELASSAGHDGHVVLFHDYGGTIIVVLWLFAFWIFVQRFILAAPTEEAEVLA